MKRAKKWFPYVRIAIVCIVIVVSCRPGIVHAIAFRNLDFEAAVIGTPVPYTSELPASAALPYWTTNNYHPGYVTYDTGSLGSTMVSIQDGLDPYHLGYVFMHPLEGRYSVFLQSGYGSGGPGPEAAWISQTGDVPSSARSLMFSSDLLDGGNLVVSLNGTVIPMSLYSVGATVNSRFGPVNTFIGDISAFSGQQNVALRFEAVPWSPPYCNATLDAITFSTTVAPEPSSLVLLAVGILSLAGYYWRRRNRAT